MFIDTKSHLQSFVKDVVIIRKYKTFRKNNILDSIHEDALVPSNELIYNVPIVIAHRHLMKLHYQLFGNQ